MTQEATHTKHPGEISNSHITEKKYFADSMQGKKNLSGNNENERVFDVDNNVFNFSYNFNKLFTMGRKYTQKYPLLSLGAALLIGTISGSIMTVSMRAGKKI